ncbi:MAG: hypothetical protein LIP02_14885 [Bacteroidales bacterium]|nr:hypothetical protein [Bacteroidales bacterium]
MKKSHITYLKKAVGVAIQLRRPAAIMAALAKVKRSNAAEYGVMDDIVSDARFFGVADHVEYWRYYSIWEILKFVDSIPQEDWADPLRVTSLKEDFLNDWLVKHIFPMAVDDKRRRETSARWNLTLIERGGEGQPNEGMHGPGMAAGQADFSASVSDCTQNNPSSEGKRLPLEIEKWNAGRGAEDSHQADAKVLQAMDPELVRLAMMLGRSGGISEVNSRFLHASKNDISGITIGDNLNSVMPIELALLGSPATEDIFIRKFTQKQLQVFASKSTGAGDGKQKKGPILMCVDTSGSMQGDPETVAKTLAIAIAIVAQKERRPVVLINYSHRLSFFVLTHLDSQLPRLLSFLSTSYAGGNDEDLLFDFVFNQLPCSQKYKGVMKAFKGADLLVVSDFEWQPLDPDKAQLLEDAKADGMRTFSLIIDCYGHRVCRPSSFNRLRYQGKDSDFVCKDGDWFISNSDHSFLYHNHRITPYTPSP